MNWGDGPTTARRRKADSEGLRNAKKQGQSHRICSQPFRSIGDPLTQMSSVQSSRHGQPTALFGRITGPFDEVFLATAHAMLC